jgi:hypothetical protein
MKREYYYHGGTYVPNKVYWSTIHSAEEWDIWSTKSYYFPFAEKIAQMPCGWTLLKTYICIRAWLESK